MIGCGTSRCDHIYSGILYHKKNVTTQRFLNPSGFRFSEICGTNNRGRGEARRACPWPSPEPALEKSGDRLSASSAVKRLSNN